MPKRHIDPIACGRIRLRLLEEADLAMTLRWRNQDHVRRWFFHSAVLTAEEHRAWWERYRTRDDDVVFVIEETEALRRPVGQVALYNIDWSTGRAEFGRLMIGEIEARGFGLARLATACLVDEALGRWGLGEVYLEVFGDNTAAIRVYAECGFEETARRDRTVAMRRRMFETRSETN